MTRTLCLLLVMSLTIGCSTGQLSRTSRTQQRVADLQERAQASADKGHDHDADRLLSQALQLTAALDDQPGQAAVLLQQARLARQRGELAKAAAILDRADTLTDTAALAADLAQERALQELAAGRLDQALQWADQARQRERGPLLGRRYALLARLALLQDRPTDAGTLAEQALRHLTADQLAAERANALRILGTVRVRQQRHDQAEQLLLQALVLDKDLELPARIAADLEALAELAGQRGDQERQQEFLRRAQTVRDSIGKAGRQ